MYTKSWLTRILQTKSKVKQLIQQDDKDIKWETLKEGYKAATYDIGGDEKWALIYSEQAYQQEFKTFERKITKAKDNATKSLKKLCKAVYACETDAMKAAEKWLKRQRFHCVEFTVESHERYNKPGKPAKGAEPTVLILILKGILEITIKLKMNMPIN